MADHPKEIKVITLNCWGLKFLSAQRVPRLKEIGRRLAITSPPADIVALQECWTQEDYLFIRQQTATILPYGKFYHSGVFGGGLAILSRWPIEESSMIRYPLNGRPTAFYRGDFFVGKGVATARVRFGPGSKDVVEVFNTHTHASYGDGSDDSYVCHQTAQAWEMAKLLRGAYERGHLVLALGDFNMVPSSFAHRLITSHAPVRDVWRVIHPDSSVGQADDPEEMARKRPIPTAEFDILENGVTSGSVYNTWRWSKEEQKKLGRGKEVVEIPPDTLDPKGKRLDYIFAGDGTTGAGGWTVKSVKVCMLERHPDLGCSLSDHFAVEATLAFHSASSDDLGTDDETKKGAATVSSEAYSRHRRERDQSSLTITNEDEEEALQNGAFLRLQSSVTSLKGGKTKLENALGGFDKEGLGLPASTYDEILAIISKYVAREHTQQRWRGIHFFASVVVTIGCLIAVWFSPRNFVAFLLMLLSSLGLEAGTIDGLIALLFVNTELRALKEFEWEILNARAAAGGGQPMVEKLL